MDEDVLAQYVIIAQKSLRPYIFYETQPEIYLHMQARGFTPSYSYILKQTQHLEARPCGSLNILIVYSYLGSVLHSRPVSRSTCWLDNTEIIT